ncbi:hypothetical protein [Micromonospora rubida]
MTQVVIAPSYGNRASRQRFAETLERTVPFREPHLESLLTDERREALWAMHPAGEARFWAATSVHNKNMERLKAGDVVLFTGLKNVQGVGEVGYSFRNAAFADSLWTPDPGGDSWSNVYSLLSFQRVLIPYGEIWDLPGFNAGDMFMSLRFLSKDKGDAVLDGLAIETRTEALEQARNQAAVEGALAGGQAKIIGVEAVHTSETSYERTGGITLVRRAEALLVNEYRSTLTGVTVDRMKASSGITDLYVNGPGGVEIIEAKSGGGHKFVRQALGQLLDYAPHSPMLADRLSALFPARPADLDIALLHRYGIDCIYRTRPGEFVRLEAPSATRTYMQKCWSAD